MTGYQAPWDQKYLADMQALLTRVATLERQMAQVVSVPLGAWTNYTPAWTAATTNPSVGSGHIWGRYTKLGRLVVAAVTLNMATSTTYGTGAWSMSIPFTTVNPPTNYIGEWYGVGAGAAGVCIALGGGTVALYTDAGVAVDATHPVTWASGNQLNINLTYESDS